MDNKVEIIVGAQDNSRLDLDSLRKRLEDIGKKVETARVDLKGDKEAEVALERLAIKAAAWGRRADSAKIGLAGAARAEVELAALDLGLDHLNDKSGRSGGIMSKLSGALSGMGSALAGLLGNLPVVGSGIEALGAGGVIAGVALAGLVVVAGALLVALGPLVAGLGVVTAGIAAFAAGAVPEVMKVWDAVSKGGKAFRDLSPAEKQVGDQMKGLKGLFDDFSKALKPEVLKSFGDALKIVKDVMPALEPLAKAAGKALDGLLKNIDNWINSPSGKKFLLWMESEGPKAMATFGKAVWDIINVIGRLLYWWDRLGNDLVSGAETWGSAILHAAGNVLHALQNMADGFIAAMKPIVDVAASIPGPWQGTARKLQASLGGMKTSVDNFFNGAIGKVNDWSRTLANAPKVAKLQGDISDLTTKLRNAASELKNPDLTKTRRAQIEANIAQLESALARARSALAAINGTTATTYVDTVRRIFGRGGGPDPLGHAAGGITGAASGGLRTGLTMVGERGRELVQLPAGSRVYSNNQTEQMMAAGGGPVKVVLEFRGGQSDFDRFMLKWIKNSVRVQGGGNVQAALGWQQ